MIKYFYNLLSLSLSLFLSGHKRNIFGFYLFTGIANGRWQQKVIKGQLNLPMHRSHLSLLFWMRKKKHHLAGKFQIYDHFTDWISLECCDNGHLKCDEMLKDESKSVPIKIFRLFWNKAVYWCCEGSIGATGPEFFFFFCCCFVS